ncbi:MAG: signal peptidase I [Flavobacteriaceae bacterium]
MTFTEWLLFFLLVQLVHFAGTWKLYQKAGRKAWEAAIPVYNVIVLLGIIKRPKWWTILLFFPIVNLLMFPILWIESARSFGFYQRKDTALVVLTLGLYLFYINYATDAKYRADRSLDPRTPLGEWVSSIAFAIIAATMVHTYFMQPYTIPTSSLEKTLLVGDYLFVSKFHYGARIPMTTIAAPMLHDSLPTAILTGKNTKSYLRSPQLPYMRMPGLQKIKRNDIVVFSWPTDTLVHWTNPGKGIDHKPIDKRSNYVKRCVGIPGDSLSLVDGYVYINGKLNELPDRAKLQFFYTYTTKGNISENNMPRFVRDKERSYVFSIPTKYWDDPTVQRRFIKDEVAATKLFGDSIRTEFKGNLSQELFNRLEINIVQNKRNINLTDEEAEKLRKQSQTVSLEKIIHDADPKVFPHTSNGWSQDNFGPMYIPEAGKTVSLNLESLPFYKEIITRYEYNNLDVIGENIYINGKKATSYTFKQDYYWMMGDNRHNSLDARYWGFVPYDHVLGKPVFIWFSWDADAPSLGAKIKSIRWDRMFTTVGGSGEPVSYLMYFVIALGLYIVYSFYRKRKKAK